MGGMLPHLGRPHILPLAAQLPPTELIAVLVGLRLISLERFCFHIISETNDMAARGRKCGPGRMGKVAAAHRRWQRLAGPAAAAAGRQRRRQHMLAQGISGGCLFLRKASAAAAHACKGKEAALAAPAAPAARSCWKAAQRLYRAGVPRAECRAVGLARPGARAYK